MNIKDFIAQAIFFAVLVTVFQYFIGSYFNPTPKETTSLSGQSFVAPELQKSQKPLNLDVVMDEEKEQGEFSEHKVSTDLATYTFSSRGAVLESLNIGWQNNTMNIELLAPESQCFFVAFEGKSPVRYDFVKEYAVDGKNATAVEYRAKFDGGDIVKTFVVYQNTYQVDLSVALNYDAPELAKSEMLRVLFPMPVNLDTVVSPMGSHSHDIQGITNKAVSSGAVSLRNINLCKQIQEFVFEPKVFGFSDKFLVQSYVQKNEQKPLRAYFKQIDSNTYQAILESNSFSKEHQQSWSFYMGPKVESALNVVCPALDETIDYGWFSFLAKPMFKALKMLKDYMGNYGIAIIMLTLILNLLLMPFRISGEKSMKQQAEFQKKLAYLRQKHKHDKEALDAASAELIKKHGMPGFIGCLPMLLNIPFFIALSRVLSCSFELYGAHFLWIADLSAKDPYYILGALTGLIMLLTPAIDPKQTAMRYGSALIFGTVTMYLSSGLALFICMNTVLNLLQGFITRRFKSNTPNIL